MAATAERIEQNSGNPAVNDASANLYADARNQVEPPTRGIKPPANDANQTGVTGGSAAKLDTPVPTAADNPASGTAVDKSAADSASPMHRTVHEGDTLSQIAYETLGQGASRRDIYNYVNQIARTNHLDSADVIADKQDLIIPEFKDPHKAADATQQKTDAAAGQDGKVDNTGEGTGDGKAKQLTPEQQAQKAQEIYTQLHKAFPSGNDLMAAFGKDQNGTITPADINNKIKELEPNTFAAKDPTFDKIVALQDLSQALALVPDKNLTAERYDAFLASLQAPPAKVENNPAASGDGTTVVDNPPTADTTQVDTAQAEATRLANMSAVFPTGADLMKAFGQDASGQITPADIDNAITQLTPDKFAPNNGTYNEIQALTDLRDSISGRPLAYIDAAYYDKMLQDMKPQETAAPVEPPKTPQELTAPETMQLNDSTG